ncbi:hypothetical protein OB952_07930 [Aeromonas salmonicida]|jgi:hypothetical protein|uniref:hypothetical protein n=1 Tax=Aeromonas salmonicida TaxID=645 RepID=UPI00259D5850|nr:hypothetical protein [Aeromonas salmonicida]MDM5067293.1 hypothetical protein [Aeromonas salmonicida]
MMDIKGWVGLSMAGYGIYLLASGSAVVVGGTHNLLQTQASMCVQGLDGSLPGPLAEQCSVLFTKPVKLVTRTAGGDALMAGVQVTRYDMSQIHHAVMVGAPDSMASAASFDVWWNNLPVEGS